ncbi:MAG: hypothetical protein Q4E10_04645 [Porphyromonas sp.]|nr:hypothetical protein [Porphyromonas sp.]
MMKLRLQILLSILTALLGVACQSPHNEEEIPLPLPPKEIDEVVLRVTMPDLVEAPGVTGALAYYWSDDDRLRVTVDAGGQMRQMTLSQPTVSSDGKSASFVLKLPQSAIGKSLGLTAEVVHSEGENESDNDRELMLYQLLPIDNWSGTMPFNLRKAGGHFPLFIQQKGVTPTAEPIDLQLATVGTFSLIQLTNIGSTELQLPSDLALSADQAWLFKAPYLAYDFEQHRLVGEKSGKRLPLMSGTVKLEPRSSRTLLLWLPETADGIEVKATSGAQESNSHPYGDALYIGIDGDGILQLQGDGFVSESADTSKGGDPYFDFNNIQYWCGEGEQSAALVIDWQEEGDHEALVWGYRYDGVKTTGDMLEEIANSDPRLAIVSGDNSGAGRFLYSIGYSVGAVNTPWEVYFEEKPLQKRSVGVFDYTKDNYRTAVDHLTTNQEEAKWRTGAYTNGYWAFFYKANRVSAFGFSNFGIWQQELTDGSWHGLSWSPLDMEHQQNNLLSNRFKAVEAL